MNPHLQVHTSYPGTITNSAMFHSESIPVFVNVNVIYNVNVQCKLQCKCKLYGHSPS